MYQNMEGFEMFCCEASPVPEDVPGFRPYACSQRAGHGGDHLAEGEDSDGVVSFIARWPQYEEIR